MARIRTIKPEAFQSETLAAVSVNAERTMFGLSTQADDRGRHADKPAVINGAIWPLRPEHTVVDLESELLELEQVGLVCRYVGCDGKRYVHLVSWDQHQKIEKPSRSRMPRCPHHPVSTTGVVEKCGRHEDDACPLPESSPNPPRTFGESSGRVRDDFARLLDTDQVATVAASADPDGAERGSAKNARSEAPSPNPPRTLGEPSPSGPRTLDRGPRTVPPPAGAPRSDDSDSEAETSAQTIVAEWIERCRKRPPGQVIGMVAKAVKAMLAEGVDPDDIRRGLATWMTKNLHPSTLPSVVNEVMNVRPGAIVPSPRAATPLDKQCPEHRGQPADRCGLCAADAKAAAGRVAIA